MAITACDPPVFEIAILLPETGPDASYGLAARRGSELAIDELEAAGQAKHLNIAILDTGSDPEQARRLLAERFADDTLVAIGGITSQEAASMAAVAEEHQRVLLSPTSNNSRLSEGSAYFYRLAISDLTAGSTLADFSRRELHLGKILLLAEDADLLSGLEEGFRPPFESAGGSVVAATEAPADDADLQALLAEHQPQAIYVDASTQGLQALIRRLREQRFKGKILTTETLASPASLRAMGQDAVGVVLAKSVLESGANNPRATAFIESYQAKFGESPDIVAAQAYDAVHVLAVALRDRPAIPSSVRKGLRDDVKDFAGASGMIQFNGAGSISRYPRVYRVAEDFSLSDYAQELKVEREAKERERQAILDRIEALRQQRLNEAQAAAGGS